MENKNIIDSHWAYDDMPEMSDIDDLLNNPDKKKSL